MLSSWCVPADFHNHSSQPTCDGQTSSPQSGCCPETIDSDRRGHRMNKCASSIIRATSRTGPHAGRDRRCACGRRSGSASSTRSAQGDSRKRRSNQAGEADARPRQTQTRSAEGGVGARIGTDTDYRPVGRDAAKQQVPAGPAGTARRNVGRSVSAKMRLPPRSNAGRRSAIGWASQPGWPG